MLLVLATCVTWWFLYSFKPDDVTRNFLSFIHASTAMLFYLFNYHVRDLYYISMGYYILDLVHELKAMKKAGQMTILHFGLIVHHILMILTLGTLFDPVTGPYYYRGFFAAEFSNYPMYAYFHTRAANYKDRTTDLVLLFLQALLYFFLRIVEIGFIIYETYNNGILYGWLFVASLMIYTLSCVWFYKVSKKFIIKWRAP